jgi:hypothetical protein
MADSWHLAMREELGGRWKPHYYCEGCDQVSLRWRWRWRWRWRMGDGANDVVCRAWMMCLLMGNYWGSHRMSVVCAVRRIFLMEMIGLVLCSTDRAARWALIILAISARIYYDCYELSTPYQIFKRRVSVIQWAKVK